MSSTMYAGSSRRCGPAFVSSCYIIMAQVNGKMKVALTTYGEEVEKSY